MGFAETIPASVVNPDEEAIRKVAVALTNLDEPVLKAFEGVESLADVDVEATDWDTIEKNAGIIYRVAGEFRLRIDGPKRERKNGNGK
jgi:hypothetical protein